MLVAPKYASQIRPSVIRDLSETPVPWGPTGYIVYKRTYARLIPELGRTEEWHETVERCCNGLLEIGAAFTEPQIERLAYFIHQLKGSPAGRPLWQLNTDTVRKLGGDSLSNCWVVSIDSCIDPFTFAFNQLMLGGGVGFNITPEVVFALPPVKFAPRVERVDDFDCDYIVPDSREGWVGLLRKVLEAFFFGGKNFRYDTRCIRPKGRPIKGFGGVASGPEELVQGIGQIAAILTSAHGRKLKPIECMDIMNIIGSIVVSGNVRRSAEIALGDPYDREFLGAKDWSKSRVPAHRQMSNNTVICDDVAKLPKAFWRGYEGSGEPYGLFNMALCKSHGRLADGEGYRPDIDIVGCNPCGEISLENFEACNLTETFLPNIRDAAEFAEVNSLLLRAAKAITCLPYNHPRSDEVVKRNRRIGMSITGFHQAPHLRDAGTFDVVYKHLEAEDAALSKEMGINRSIKISTVKPSGCSRRDTMVSTDRGLLRLDELGDVSGPEWQCIEGHGACTETGTHPITKFYVNGLVATRKIGTADGVELESSLDHKYQVFEQGWKSTKDLAVGDRLLVKLGTQPEELVSPLQMIEQSSATNSQEMIQPPVLTPDIAYFLGLFYGNGSVHKKGVRISFNRQQPSLVKWMIDFVGGTFGISHSIEEKSDTGAGSFCVNSQNFLRWLSSNGILKGHCEDIAIPRCIRVAGREVISAFIDGYWRVDGGIHNAGNSWSVCTVSETFARQFQQLCRVAGFNVKLSNAGPGGLGARDRWLVAVRHMRPDAMKYISKTLRARLAGAYWLDPIISLEESRCETYDIEVDQVHCYLANGTVSHNTLSLLAGCTPGVHAAYSPNYIRRVTFAANDPLVNVARDHGYVVVPKRNIDGSKDLNTLVAEFPCKTPEGTRCANGYSAIEQLEDQKFLQTHWADNSVSMTCYYQKKELPEIRLWLEANYKTSVKTASFLLHQDHGFEQAPYEEITESQYQRLAAKCRPITKLSDDRELALAESVECSSGTCPVR